MPCRLPRLCAALCLCLLAATPAAAGATPPAHGKGAPAAAVLTLGPHLAGGPGIAVTMPPAGLSLEYPQMAQALGSGPCPPPALTAELLHLGSPPLQLAGQSQDFTMPSELAGGPPASWEAVNTYVLPGGFWERLHCLLASTREPLTVGLNARIGQLAWAQQMVADAQAAATAGLGFSLGNEPDHYYLPDYASLDKPQPREEALDVARYLQVAEYLRPAVGQAPLMGPEMSHPDAWRASLAHVLGALHEQAVGVHAYPLSVCATPRAATLHGLLSGRAAEEPRRLGWVARLAATLGLPAIVSEANSVSCGGKPGVSDTPAAAVWAVRFVLSALLSGFREVRFHFSGNSYDPFAVRGGAIVRRPLEEAIAALNRWLPAGATLRALAPIGGLGLSSVSAAGAPPLAIVDNRGAGPRELLLRGAQAVTVRLFSPARRGAATLRLAAVRGVARLALPAQAVAAIAPAP